MRLDLFWRHAVIERGDHNHRNVDVWKQIDWHTRNCCCADHRDDQTDHDDEERITQRKTGHLLRLRLMEARDCIDLRLHQLSGLVRRQIRGNDPITLF